MYCSPRSTGVSPLRICSILSGIIGKRATSVRDIGEEETAKPICPTRNSDRALGRFIMWLQLQ